MANALIIVDYQNDFLPGGALAVPSGDEVLGIINSLIRGDYDVVVASQDWHPPDHLSFAAQGGPWPVHCEADTTGAALHPQLDRSRIDTFVRKGTESDREAYSAFDQTDLAGYLRSEDVDTVDVVGLALDYCVRATALQAVQNGFKTRVLLDATRSIGPVEPVVEELERAGVEVAESGVAQGIRG